MLQQHRLPPLSTAPISGPGPGPAFRNPLHAQYITIFGFHLHHQQRKTQKTRVSDNPPVLQIKDQVNESYNNASPQTPRTCSRLG